MKTSERVLYRYIRATQEIEEVATGLPVPPVRESPGFCGPSSLRAVLLYYGKDVSEAEIGRLAGTTAEDGTPSKNLLEAARKLGFDGFAKDNASLDDVLKWISKGVPVIVDWFSTDEGHYSVLKTIQDNKVYLMDPELGDERELELDAFKRVWFDFEGDTEKHEHLFQHEIIVVYPKGEKKIKGNL